VRLPREWLGPREELVPFAIDDEPVDQLASPPSTHDFWGEARDDGWATPTEETAPEPRYRLPRRRGVTHARETGFRRFLRRSLNRAPSIGFSTRAQSPAAVPRRWRPSAGVAVAVVLTVIGVFVSAGGQTGAPAPSVRSTHASVAQETATVAAGIGFDSAGSSGRLHARPSALRTRPAAHRTSSTRQTSRPTRRRATRHVMPHTRTITIEPVRYTAPAVTTTSSSPSGAPRVTTPVSPPATAATRTSAGSHQPATGASGALGPGSSPDG
jgi:hypothetical protein